MRSVFPPRGDGGVAWLWALVQACARRSLHAAVCVGVACMLLAPRGGAQAGEGNLLAERAPSRVQGMRNVGVLTDGVRARNGDPWKTDLTATFDDGEAFVEYDLGARVPIVGAYLQGDNNDVYTLSGSDDGVRFREIWRARDVGTSGLQPRSTRVLEDTVRYVRVSARGGDGSYSLSELQLFSRVPAVFPPELQVRGGTSDALRVRDAILLFALGCMVFLSICTRKTSLVRALILALIPLTTAYLLLATLLDAWPAGPAEVSLMRGVAAAIAVFALLRERAMRERFPVHPRAVLAALGLSAALAFASFYNLGHFQSWDHARAKPEFVHTWDMRIYHPFAKYFEELRYDGVYKASVLAYAEDTGTSLEAIGNTNIRSMKTHNMQRVSEVADEIRAISGRFSPERWLEFKRDMTYFREVMGPTYLTTHHDHGSNGTPVWVAFAKLLFGGRPATEGVLVLGGLLDVALFVALFVVMWRTFGVRLALLAIVVFGANDYYMFGSNWAGATLRHDWLVYLGFGVCALRVERWWLAGVFFGLSTMIRAFPGAALIGVSLPAAFWLAEYWYKQRRLPDLRTFLGAHGGAVRVVAGAVACMAVTFVLTGLWFSFGLWGEWWQKVTLLNSSAGANDVSLKALLGASNRAIALGVKAQAAVFGAAFIVCIVFIVLACRRRRLDQAVLLALPLIPVLTNPANYYLHFIFLLPLLIDTDGERVAAEVPAPAPATEEGAAPAAPVPPIATALRLPPLSVAGPLLAICVAQYWISQDADIDRRFQTATGLLLAGLGWIYVRILQHDDVL